MEGRSAALLGIAAAGLCSLLVLLGWQPSAGPASVPSSSASGASASLEALPLSFEPNAGRFGRRTDFVSRGRGYSLGLQAGGALLALDRGRRQASLAIELVGADRSAPARGAEQLPGKVNSFVGNDPAQWKRGIPTYERVVYEEVYPGIGVEWYGRGRHLEHDFKLAPGADPDRIRIGFEGAESVSIAPNGDLLIGVAGKTLRQRAPVAFQGTGGARRSVDSRYVLDGSRISFELGAYDRSQPLTIDPLVLTYSSFLGGSGSDQPGGIAVDPRGYSYVTGNTASADFPTEVNSDNVFYSPDSSRDGAEDAFIAKLDNTGRFLEYSTYLGGSGTDGGLEIDVNDAGVTAITGTTNGGSFPIFNPATAFQAADPSPAAPDAFVARLDEFGDLNYSTYLGGPAAGTQGLGAAIGIESSGRLVVAGNTNDSDFPITAATAFDTGYNGGVDAFFSRLNPAASGAAQLLYSTYLGGGGDDFASALALDSFDKPWITGVAGIGFPATANAYDTVHGANADAYAAKLDPVQTGSASLPYSTYLGGDGSDNGSDVAIDAAGKPYIAGVTSAPGAGTHYPTTPGAFQEAPVVGGEDAFLTRLDPGAPTKPEHNSYSTLFGGAGLDNAAGVAIDSFGDGTIGGQTLSADLPTPGGFDQTYAGPPQSDGFVARFDLSPGGNGGGDLVSATYLGDVDFDTVWDLALDTAGNPHVFAWTGSGKFPTTADAFDSSFNGGLDVAVVRLCPGGAQIDGSPLNVSITCQGNLQAHFDGEAFDRFDESLPGRALAGLELAGVGGVFGSFPFQSLAPPSITGSGTPGDPFVMTSEFRAVSFGAQLDVVEVDTYVNGDDGFTSTYTVSNSGMTLAFFNPVVAADLQPVGEDLGVGRQDLGSPRFLSSLTDPYQTGDGLIETTPWSTYEEGDLNAVRPEIASGTLDGTIASSNHDTTVAAEWYRHGGGGEVPLQAPLDPGMSDPPFSVRWQFRRVPPPIHGQKVVLRNTGGTVLVKAPGQSSFFNLTDPRRVPIGSLIDVRNGFVEVTAENAAGVDETATFWSGLFEAQQSGDPFTARLAEDLNCGKKKKKKRKNKSAGASALAQAAAASRQLWAKGKGRFRTSGYRGSATIRGTEWLTTDRCAGKKRTTQFRVVEGQVEIDDFSKKGSVNKLLSPGKPYLAGKPKKKKKK